MNIKILHKSKFLRATLIIIGVIITLLSVLGLGIKIGYHKARFSEHFGNNFEKNFLGPRDGMKKEMFGKKIPGGHGAVGEIVHVDFPLFVISGKDNLEKTIVLATTTKIHKFQDEIGTSTLTVGDFVVVLGNPNDQGQIQAKLVRVMPHTNQNQIRKTQ